MSKETAMSAEQRELVKQSWAQLQRIEPLVIGNLFYTKLFLEHPQLQHLFTNSKVQQAQKLMDTLAAVIENLDTLDQLTQTIESLALRHLDYGVKKDHYSIVGQVLLWTLKTASPFWNVEVEKAWAACYGTLANTMIKAAYREEQ